jgi:hypothetical protein
MHLYYPEIIEFAERIAVTGPQPKALCIQYPHDRRLRLNRMFSSPQAARLMSMEQCDTLGPL